MLFIFSVASVEVYVIFDFFRLSSFFSWQIFFRSLVISWFSTHTNTHFSSPFVDRLLASTASVYFLWSVFNALPNFYFMAYKNLGSSCQLTLFSGFITVTLHNNADEAKQQSPLASFISVMDTHTIVSHSRSLNLYLVNTWIKKRECFHGFWPLCVSQMWMGESFEYPKLGYVSRSLSLYLLFFKNLAPPKRQTPIKQYRRFISTKSHLNSFSCFRIRVSLGFI